MTDAGKYSVAQSQAAVEELFKEYSLYAPLDLEDSDQGRHTLFLIENGSLQFDCYCVDCGRDSVFKAPDRPDQDVRIYLQLNHRSMNNLAAPTPGTDPIRKRWLKSFTVECQRERKHAYIFELYLSNMKIMKYGQLPSIEDIASSDIKKFRGILGNDYFLELRKATGLFSHGIGIGSFVYLRRIFERLIYTHYNEFKDSNQEIDGFNTFRMEDKINALATVLPKSLVTNRAIYSILSKGIHELGEDECKSYFPVVKAAIIGILEQDLADKEKEDAERRMAASISKIARELKPKA